MEGITTKKVQMLMERSGLSEEDAIALLEKNQGDLIETLIFCEREKEKKKYTNEKINADEFVDYIKNLIKSGNVTRIIIRSENNILVNIPVNAGILVSLALLLQPILILIGAATAVVVDLEVDIIKEDGTVEVINKLVKTSFKSTIDKAEKVTEVLMQKANETKDAIKNKLKDRK